MRHRSWGTNRIEIDRMTVFGQHSRADSGTRVRRTAKGWSVEQGPVAGDVTLKRLPSGFLYASLSARGGDERFWEVERFGLKGIDTAILALRLPGFSHGLTGSMTELFWTKPFFPRRVREVPENTQFLLWEERNGFYGVILPLASGDARSFLRGGKRGLELHVSTGMEGLLRMEAPLFVAGFGKDPYRLTRDVYRAAALATGKTRVLRVNKPYPEPFEYLGWCTWDAFYRSVNARGVLSKMREFDRKGVKTGFVLIDDGWYPMKDAKLTDTRTDRRKFPGGLGPAVRRIKRVHGVPYVGAWHCHTGYWMGAHPDHHLPAPERDHLQGDPEAGYYFPALDAKGAKVFFEAWHRRMRREGIDFVKVDGQGSIARFCANRMPFTRAAAASEKALQDSCDRHFKGRLLNCMSMGHDLMWTWDRSNLTRSSNDFYPRKKGSHAEHARWNAYNSLWFSQVTWCDWDMWWTGIENAGFHQILRAVSGGPVYMSDRVGATRPELLKPLALSDGRLLRCDDVGIPTPDCLFSDAGCSSRPLKIMNRSGTSGVLAAVHAAEERPVVRGEWRPSDIRGLKGDLFAVRCHPTGELRLMKAGQAWSLRLGTAEALLFIAVPVVNGFAAIGLADKVISCKAVQKVRRQGRRIRVVLAEGGTFSAYSERPPTQVLCGGRILPFSWRRGWLEAAVPLRPGRREILEIVLV